jgi:hypothetical protein
MLYYTIEVYIQEKTEVCHVIKDELHPQTIHQYRVWFSGFRRQHDISEENIASIFRVEGEDKQETELHRVRTQKTEGLMLTVTAVGWCRVNCCRASSAQPFFMSGSVRPLSTSDGCDNFKSIACGTFHASVTYVLDVAHRKFRYSVRGR